MAAVIEQSVAVWITAPGVLEIPGPQIADAGGRAVARARAKDVAVAIERHRGGALVGGQGLGLGQGRGVDGFAVTIPPIQAAHHPAALHERHGLGVGRDIGRYRQACRRGKRNNQPRHQVIPFHGYIPPRDCLASGHSHLPPVPVRAMAQMGWRRGGANGPS